MCQSWHWTPSAFRGWMGWGHPADRAPPPGPLPPREELERSLASGKAQVGLAKAKGRRLAVAALTQGPLGSESRTAAARPPALSPPSSPAFQLLGGGVPRAPAVSGAPAVRGHRGAPGSPPASGRRLRVGPLCLRVGHTPIPEPIPGPRGAGDSGWPCLDQVANSATWGGKMVPEREVKFSAPVGVSRRPSDHHHAPRPSLPTSVHLQGQAATLRGQLCAGGQGDQGGHGSGRGAPFARSSNLALRTARGPAGGCWAPAPSCICPAGRGRREACWWRGLGDAAGLRGRVWRAHCHPGERGWSRGRQRRLQRVPGRAGGLRDLGGRAFNWGRLEFLLLSWSQSPICETSGCSLRFRLAWTRVGFSLGAWGPG